jgi:hypothetical protein
VCAQLVSEDDSEYIAQQDDIMTVITGENRVKRLDQCGIVEDGRVRICPTCLWSLKRQKVPEGAISNGFEVGCEKDYPWYLNNLTDTEEMLIAKARPFGKIRKISCNGTSEASYRHLGGHVVVIPQNVASVYRILPQGDIKWTEVMKVIWVGKDKPKYEDLKPYLEIRRDVVWQALIGLKRDNRVYHDVEVNEEVLKSWDE